MNRSVKRTYNSTLRAEQAEETGRRILDAAIDVLAAGDELTIGDVADRAGVSARTVYNRFGSVDLLRDAAAEHLNDVVLPDYPYADARELVDAMRRGWRLSPEQERILRATSALASKNRPTRYAKIRKAVEPITDHLDERDARIGLAAITMVRGASAYLALRDDAGLTSDEAADAMAWLVDVASADLRRRNRRAVRT